MESRSQLSLSEASLDSVLFLFLTNRRHFMNESQFSAGKNLFENCLKLHCIFSDFNNSFTTA